LNITTGHKVGQNHRSKHWLWRHGDTRVPCCRWSNDTKGIGGEMIGVAQPPSSQLSAVAGVR
jgi:hypothetical protein